MPFPKELARAQQKSIQDEIARHAASNRARRGSVARRPNLSNDGSQYRFTLASIGRAVTE